MPDYWVLEADIRAMNSMSEHPSPPKNCPICSAKLVPYGVSPNFEGDHCPSRCFGAYRSECGRKAENEKLIYWCIRGLGLEGEQMTPDEFVRFLKIRAFK